MLGAIVAQCIQTKGASSSLVEQFWPSYYRSHPFPIQWDTFWHFIAEHWVYVRREIPEIHFLLCRAAEYEAYFHIRQSRLHSVFAKSLLLARGIIAGIYHLEFAEIGDNNTWSYSTVIRAIHSSTSAGLATIFLNFIFPSLLSVNFILRFSRVCSHSNVAFAMHTGHRISGLSITWPIKQL